MLKVSSNATTTLPVVQGGHLLDRILGTPPDPARKNIKTIDPDIREQLADRQTL